MYINVTQKARPMFRSYPSVDDPDTAKVLARANPLYSWHASYFTSQHRRVVGFINDASGLFIVVPNVTAADYSHLQKSFEEQLTRQFRQLGMTHQQVTQYLQRAGQWQINKTVDRSIVGKLTTKMSWTKSLVGNSMPQMIRALLGIQGADYSATTFINLPAWQKPAPTAAQSPAQKLKLQNAIQQLRYISEHSDELLASPQFNTQIDKIQQQNDTLITAFVDANRSQLSPKTIRRHRDRLTRYLDYLSETLETIVSAEALDLEAALYDGYSFSEMLQTKTALKKFYRFLADQRLIGRDEWLRIKERLAAELQDGDPNKELNDVMSFVNNYHASLPREAEELLKRYGTACANLYGLISCDQLYRIMTQQNPDVELVPGQLIDWFEKHFNRRRDDFVVSDVMEVPSIIHPTVYDQRVEENLLSRQIGIPYYLPAKNELLKYQDPAYFADTGRLKKYQTALHKFVGVPQDQLVGWTNIAWQRQNKYFLQKETDLLHDLNEEMSDAGYVCPSQEEVEKWLSALFDLLNNNRLWINRGHTPNEARQLGSIIEPLRKRKRLSPKMVKEIKAARLDPMDIMLALSILDDFTKKQISQIEDQVADLPILRLD